MLANRDTDTGFSTDGRHVNIPIRLNVTVSQVLELKEPVQDWENTLDLNGRG